MELFCGSNCNCNCNQPHRKPKQSALHRQNNLNIVAKCPFLVFRVICTFPHLFANLPAKIVPQDSHPPSSHTRAATTMLLSSQSRYIVAIQVPSASRLPDKVNTAWIWCWSTVEVILTTIRILFPWLAFSKPFLSSCRLWCTQAGIPGI